jgi:hypothetical protein
LMTAVVAISAPVTGNRRSFYRAVAYLTWALGASLLGGFLVGRGLAVSIGTFGHPRITGCRVVLLSQRLILRGVAAVNRIARDFDVWNYAGAVAG